MSFLFLSVWGLFYFKQGAKQIAKKNEYGKNYIEM